MQTIRELMKRENVIIERDTDRPECRIEYTGAGFYSADGNDPKTWIYRKGVFATYSRIKISERCK